MLLSESAAVTLDGAGNGTVQMGPAGSHEYWSPTLAVVKVTTNTNEARCILYIGPKVADAYVVDSTFTGSSGNPSDAVSGHTIGRTAEPYIWAVWSGGDPGAQATLRVIGTKEFR